MRGMRGCPEGTGAQGEKVIFNKQCAAQTSFLVTVVFISGRGSFTRMLGLCILVLVSSMLSDNHLDR
jgi:hypothetical protein